MVLAIVLYFSLKDNYEEIIEAIANMNYLWIAVALMTLIFYRILTSLGYYLIIRLNGENVSFLRCLLINFIILFFHGVTPFAGGGQPMEIYYLHNEKIPVTKATNITLQNFIVYQVALVGVGIFALIYNAFYGLFPNDHLIKRLVIFGFLINLAVLVITFVLSFGKRFNQFVSKKVVRFLGKVKIIRDEEKYQDKIQGYLTNFYRNASELKKHKLVVLECIGVNILGLVIMYSMPFAVAQGMGVDVSLVSAIVATAYIMIIGSFVPIPGGTGGIEYGFVFFFGYFVTGGVLKAMMLVWRFISYYLAMILGGCALSLYRKKERQ